MATDPYNELALKSTDPYSRLAPIENNNNDPYDELAPIKQRKQFNLDKTLQKMNLTYGAARTAWQNIFGEEFEGSKIYERGIGISVANLDKNFKEQIGEDVTPRPVESPFDIFGGTTTYNINNTKNIDYQKAIEDPGEDYKIGEKFLERSLTMIVDLPYSIPGLIMGAFTPGNIKTKLGVGSFFAAYVPESLRATYIEALSRPDDVKNWEEFWEIYIHTGIKEGTKAASRVTAGVVTPHFLPIKGLVGPLTKYIPTQSFITNWATSLAASLGMGRALNGQFDSKDDIIIESIFWTANGFGASRNKIKKMITDEQIRTKKIKRLEILDEVAKDPVMFEDLTSRNITVFRKNTDKFLDSLEHKPVNKGFELILEDNTLKVVKEIQEVAVVKSKQNFLEYEFIQEIINKIIPKEFRKQYEGFNRDKAALYWLNQWDPIKRQIKTYGERGTWDVVDPEQKFLMQSGNYAEASGYLKWGYRTKDGVQITEPYSKILNEIQKSKTLRQDLLDAYLSALDDIQSVKEGKKPKYNQESAKKTVELLKEQYEPFRKRIQKINEANLKILLDGNLLTPELYKKLLARETYAPARGIKINEDGTLAQKGSDGKPIQTKEGSTQDIYSPSYAITENIFRFTDAANKNMALKYYFDWVENVARKANPDDVTLPKKTKSIRARKLTAKELEKIMNKFFESDDTTSFTIFTKQSEKGPQNLVTYFDEGKAITYKVSDPLLYKALKGLDTGEINMLTHVGRGVTKLRRDFAVLDPEFLTIAVIKDMGIAPIVSKVGLQPWDVALGVIGQLKGRLLGTPLWKDYVQSRALGSDIASTIETYKFSNALKDPRTLKNEISFKTVTVDVFNKTKFVFRDLIGTTMENATRFREFQLSYKKAIEAGRTRAEALDIAGFYAKDIIDFSRAGLYGRAWNRYSAFFNAKIQSAAKFTQIMQNPKTRQRAFQYGLMYLTLPTIYTFLANYDDPEWINNVSDYKKKSGNQIKTTHKGDAFFMHLPDGWGEWGIIFQSLPRRALNYVLLNDKDAIKTLFTEEVMKFLYQTGGSAIPDIFKGPIETVINKQFWNMQTIYSAKDEKMVDGYTTDLKVSEVSRYLSKSSAMGLRVFSRGMINDWDGFDPKVIDYNIKSMTSAVGTSLLNGLDQILRKSGIVSRPPTPYSGKLVKDIDKLPLLKKLFIANSPKYSSTANRKFYNYYKEYQKIHATADEARKKGDKYTWKKYSNTPEYQIYIALNKVANAISKYKGEYDRYTLMPKDKITDKQRISYQETALKNIIKAAWRGVQMIEGKTVETLSWRKDAKKPERKTGKEIISDFLFKERENSDPYDKLAPK